MLLLLLWWWRLLCEWLDLLLEIGLDLYKSRLNHTERVPLSLHSYQILQLVLQIFLPSSVTVLFEQKCESLCRLWRACIIFRTDTVAHGRMITSSHQITEIEQRRARLVFGWVTAARVTLPAMCRGVGQASHITPPLSTQQWWVPGGTRKLNCNDWLQLQQSAQMLNSPQRRWDSKRVCSNTRGVNCTVCWSYGDIWTINMYIYIYIYICSLLAALSSEWCGQIQWFTLTKPLTL